MNHLNYSWILLLLSPLSKKKEAWLLLSALFLFSFSHAQVKVLVTPAVSEVTLGDVFTVEVKVESMAQQVDGANVFLTFDPAVLSVENATAGSLLSIPILPLSFNNTTGLVSYAYGTFSDLPSGSFTLFTLELKAITSGSSALSFASSNGISTDLSFRGLSVLEERVDGQVTVSGGGTGTKTDQTITFAALPDKTYTDAPFSLSANASSGLAVSFGIVSGPATVAGNTLTLTGAGTVRVRASQAGDENFNPATPVEQSFAVGKATADVLLTDMTHVFEGTQKAATVTTVPADLPVSVTYDGSSPAPTAAGAYALVATIVSANYQGSASGTFTIETAAVEATEWLGTVSSDWNDPANWTQGVPDGNLDAVIPSSTRYPVLANGSFAARNILINDGASLIMGAGSSLHISQSFVNNGNFTDAGGALSTEVIGGASTTNLRNFTVSPSGTEMTGDVTITGILTLQGDLKTNINKLLLLSNESGTAYVNNAGGKVVGNATMERYIEPTFNVGTGYRHFSSPVTSATVGNMAAEPFTPVVNPAYNTSANPYTVIPFPNVFGFNESRITNASTTASRFDYGWYSPASLASTLVPGMGYSVNIPASAKVSLSGTLHNDIIPVSGLGNGGVGNASGWHLLGNPYPSPIDWTLISKSAGIDNAVYVYQSSGQYAGSYSSFVNGINAGLADARYIAPMQGFFIHASSNDQLLTFTNSARVYNQDPVLFHTTDQRPQLQLKLTGTGAKADDAVVYFQEGATTAVNGQFDAYKVLTYHEDRPTLFARLGQDAISIKGLPLDNATHSLPLEFYVTEAGNYTFSVAKLLNFPATAQVNLLDRETSRSHDLSQSTELTLALNPATDPHRFVLNFSAVAGSPLSVGALATGVEVLVYPNPSQQDINLVISGLQASPKPVELVLYNTLGQLMLRRQVSVSEAQAGVKLQTSDFARGIYHLQIQAKGRTITRKLVLNR